MKNLSFFFLLAFLACPLRAQDAAKKTDNSKLLVLGVVDELSSASLSEKRTLNIYLPEGYNPADTLHYPVLYVLDGSLHEDFVHVTGAIQFNTLSWVNRIPPSIVVGIANVDRKRDFTFPTRIEQDKKRYTTSGGSEKFIQFIEKELQPFIEKKYKGNAQRTLIGQSLGGLLATEILFKKPHLFNKYIIISPSLWWDDASLLAMNPPVLQEGFGKKIEVYVGVGKEGLSPSVVPHVMEVDANLLAEKLQYSKNPHLKTFFDYLPQEDHATITHQAVFNAIRALFPVRK